MCELITTDNGDNEELNNKSFRDMLIFDNTDVTVVSVM